MAQSEFGVGIDFSNSGIGVDLSSTDAGVWSLDCNVSVEDLDADVQETKVSDVLLSGSIVTEELSVEIGESREAAMDLDVSVVVSGLNSSLVESQIVSYDNILKITDFSQESTNESRYASSAKAAKKIYDLAHSADEKAEVVKGKVVNLEKRVDYIEINGGGGSGGGSGEIPKELLDRIYDIEAWKEEFEDVLYVDGDNVHCDANLIVTGDTSSGGSGDPSTNQGVDEEEVIEIVEREGYVKQTDIDSSIAALNIQDYAKKTDLDAKANASEVYKKGETYSKEEIDAKDSALDERLTPVEEWKNDLSQYISVVGTDIKISTNLIVEGDTASGGTGDPSTNQGLDEEAVLDLLEREGYAKESSLASVATSGKYSDLSGLPTLGSLASKNSLAVTDIPDLSSKYLPLSGGTLKNTTYSTVLRIDGASNALMDFLSAGTKIGSFGMTASGGLVSINADGSKLYNIIHSGNYSSYALPLDGGTMNANSTIKWTHSAEENWNNAVKGLKILRYASTSNVSTNGSFANYATALHIANSATYGFQIGYNAGHTDNNYISSLKYRGYSPNNSAWGAWKTIAFTDSDITGNAATASKLASKVSLWGNDFDGSAALSGTIVVGNSTNSGELENTKVIFKTTTTGGWDRGMTMQVYDANEKVYKTRCRFGAYGNSGSALDYGYIGTGYTNTWVEFTPSKTTFKGNVYVEGNLIVSGDTSSGGSGQENPSGGITEEDVEKYLADYVNEITISGSGNVVSSVSKSGKRITFTKGITALTSHQSLKDLLGSSAIGSTSSYPYWDGNAWKTKALGSRAFDSTEYLPKAGGTITGASSSPLKIGTSSSTIGIPLLVSNSEKAWFGWSAGQGAYLWNATANKYLGIKEDGTPYFGSNTLIHSGNIGSQLVKGLAKSVTIWGQSFDGTGNIENQHLTIYKNPSGSTGAWVRGMRSMSSTDSTLATFAFHGNGDTLTKAYIGNSYTSPWVSILPSGYVGIGVADPQYKLDVNGNVAFGVASGCDVWLKRTTGYNYIHAAHSLAFTVNNDAANIAAIFGSDKKASFYGAVTMASNLSVTGKVGIGVTDPAYALDIAAGGGMQLKHTTNPHFKLTSDSYYAYVQLLSSGDLAIGKSSALGLKVAQSGAVTMPSTLNVKGPLVIDGTDATTAYLKFSRSSGANYIIAPSGGTVYVNLTGVAKLATSTLCITSTSVSKGSDQTVNLGQESNPWNTIYGVDGIFSGDTSSGSDIRFKDIIENKTIKIEDIANAPLFTFKWNDREDKTLHLGTSAQYWEAIAPELVSGSDFKTLNYASLGVAMGIALAQEVKELKAEVKRLKEKLYGQIC